MSETSTEAPQATGEAEQKPQEGSEAKTFDESYVKKLRDEAARYRTEAKANADAAKRLAEIEDAQKSETEKAADRIAKAEAEVASVPAKVAEALRSHLVTVHKISDEDAELFLTASEPELLLKQVDRLVARDANAAEEKRKRGNHVPNEGAGDRPKADPGPGIARLRDAYASTSK